MAEARRDIVVIGGGMIGGRVAHEASARGHHVTLVARDPSKIDATYEHLSVVEGDVDDPGLGEQLAGRDAVVSAVGTARAEAPDYTLYRRAAEALVSALRGLGDAAPRLIVVGGVGSLLDVSGELVLKRVPEDRLPEHLGQKEALDFYRTVSDVSWTYVSPPARIAPGDRTGSYRTGVDRLVVDDKGESSVSMEDYAVALVDEAEHPRHERRRFTVGY